MAPREPEKLRSTTIYEYFPLLQPRRVRTSFLDLPLHVRQRIYRYSGLVRACPIDLNSVSTAEEYEAEEGAQIKESSCYWSHEDGQHHDCEVGIDYDNFVSQYKCYWRNILVYSDEYDYPKEISEDVEDEERHNICEYLNTSLLFTCREVYLECLPILYGENRFRVAPRRHNGLEALSKIGALPLSYLRYLLIDLRLQSSEVICAKDVLETMMVTVFPYLAANKLSLDILLETTDHSEVTTLMAPFKQLTPIANCAIKIAARQHRALDKLATQLVKSLTATATPGFCRFAELPKEIQERIIAFASLAGFGKFDRRQTRADKHCLPTVLGGFRRAGLPFPRPCCGTCSMSHSLELDYAARQYTSCFCPSISTAASTTCSCISAPTELFTVSRSFSHVAQKCFFRENTFVVTSTDPRIYGGLVASRESLYRFLIQIPYRQILNVRKLHLRFDVPGIYTEMHMKDATELDFLRTLATMMEQVSQDLYVYRLTLILDFTELLASVVNRARQRGTSVQEVIQLPLSPPRALADFYAGTNLLYDKVGQVVARKLARPRNLWYYLAWPMAPPDQKRRDKEVALERLVMGAAYDAEKAGKPNFQLDKEWNQHNEHAICLPGGCTPGVRRDIGPWYSHCNE